MTNMNTAPTGRPAQGSGLPPTGANLPPPALPGSGPQANPGKPPGFGPIFFAIVQSFVAGKDPALLDEQKMDAILRAAEKFTDKILANYPAFGAGLNLPRPVLPDWQAEHSG